LCLSVFWFRLPVAKKIFTLLIPGVFPKPRPHPFFPCLAQVQEIARLLSMTFVEVEGDGLCAYRVILAFSKASQGWLPQVLDTLEDVWSWLTTFVTGFTREGRHVGPRELLLSRPMFPLFFEMADARGERLRYVIHPPPPPLCDTRMYFEHAHTHRRAQTRCTHTHRHPQAKTTSI
jgi:hypothetical protein